MYTFEKRDEGVLAVHESGRPAAHVETVVITENHDPRLRHPERVLTPLSRDRWRVHFTALRFSPDELRAFVEELAALPG